MVLFTLACAAAAGILGVIGLNELRNDARDEIAHSKKDTKYGGVSEIDQIIDYLAIIPNRHGLLPKEGADVVYSHVINTPGKTAADASKMKKEYLKKVKESHKTVINRAKGKREMYDSFGKNGKQAKWGITMTTGGLYTPEKLDKLYNHPLLRPILSQRPKEDVHGMPFASEIWHFSIECNSYYNAKKIISLRFDEACDDLGYDKTIQTFKFNSIDKNPERTKLPGYDPCLSDEMNQFLRENEKWHQEWRENWRKEMAEDKKKRQENYKKPMHPGDINWCCDF